MLARLIVSHSRHFRHLSTTLSPHFHPFSSSPQIPKFHSTTHFIFRHFSTNSNGNNNSGNGENPTSDFWKMGQDESNLDDIFDTHDVNLTGAREDVGRDSKFSQEQSWKISETANEGDGGLFEEFEGNESGGCGARMSPVSNFEPWKLGEEQKSNGRVFEEFGGNENGGIVAGMSPVTEFEPWKLGKEQKLEEVFDIEGGVGEDRMSEGIGGGFEKEREMVSAAQKLELEKEERALMDVLKGPNCAFGDLVAQSGITDEMLDSLIALKNFQDIEGLPPLAQIEDERYEKTTRKSSRYEMELQKQEEAAKARVRQVDEKGRAYGTGRRKCSIARVWIQPGEGKFLVNDKEYDVYFPMLDQRAALLRPFSETKTLGLWDVKCTVKGGGVSGQVGAIRLGISRALQNWEPGLRPPLREAGFLTRDPRVVERKKPGKAKARKSFQWVKR